eukprot:4385543-Pyramimonas_sp.AAC.1
MRRTAAPGTSTRLGSSSGLWSQTTGPRRPWSGCCEARRLSGVDRTPNSDTSISELSVCGFRVGAVAVIFQTCARQVWARSRFH